MSYSKIKRIRKRKCRMSRINSSFFQKVCTTLEFYSFSFTTWILWFLMESEEKLLRDISVSKLSKPPPTLSICSWSTSNWILNSRASQSSSKWSPMAPIAPLTSLIHPTVIPIFSAPRQPCLPPLKPHYRGHVGCWKTLAQHTFVDFLENKLLDRSPVKY